MSSRRLPGKVLREIAGKPMLAYVVERCRAVSRADLVAVITSREPSDDPIAAFAVDNGIEVYRGPLEDVAGRFLGAAGAFGLDAFVLTNADSPLLDPRLIDRAIGLYRETGADLVTNVLRRTFPTGMSVEVVDMKRFGDVVGEFSAEEREHVTLYYYRHKELFGIEGFENDRNLGDRSLSVDTPEDLARLEQLLRAMKQPLAEYDCNGIVALAENVGTLGAKASGVR